MIVKSITRKVKQIRRSLKACVASLTPPKSSYSQFGEDTTLLSFLKEIDQCDCDYIDVGANHPTEISNTYLLYRAGYCGVAIEPNSELSALFKIHRKRDIVLTVGCGKATSLSKFAISHSPVFSSFDESVALIVDRREYVPVLSLDAIVDGLGFNTIGLMSVDVEGWNREVLLGAERTLQKTQILCVELDDANQPDQFSDLLGDSFDFVDQFGSNRIYKHKRSV